MARKKTTPPTREEILASDLKDRLSRMKFIPEPTYRFNVGDQVAIGRLAKVFIKKVLADGKLYLLGYSAEIKNKQYVNGKYEEVITYEDGQERYAWWMDVRPKTTNTESLIKNDNIHLSFSQRSLGSLFGNVYFFGTDMDPEYQRDYCWTLEDKVALVDSIFSNIDIGKFVFVHNDYGDEYLYEILDGKQRLRAILDYYENRFPYKGKYFNDLSVRDQNWFCDKCIAVAEVSKSSKKELLRYFLMLNTAGKSMDKNHIKKIFEMYEECEG